jgi:hypothetical protein
MSPLFDDNRRQTLIRETRPVNVNDLKVAKAELPQQAVENSRDTEKFRFQNSAGAGGLVITRVEAETEPFTSRARGDCKGQRFGA